MSTPQTEVAHLTCSQDLATLIAVEWEQEVDKANLLIQDGWVVLAAGFDPNGFPSFLLGQPSEEQ